MGGHDPYSASKGCVELISHAYRKSFFEKEGISIATARAGNVVGGGDWPWIDLFPTYLVSSLKYYPFWSVAAINST